MFRVQFGGAPGRGRSVVREHRADPGRTWQLPARSLVTEQSLRTEVANAKEQIRRLTHELVVLRDRLARQLGTEADLARGREISPLVDELEERAAALESDNHRLRQRIIQLEFRGSRTR